MLGKSSKRTVWTLTVFGMATGLAAVTALPASAATASSSSSGNEVVFNTAGYTSDPCVWQSVYLQVLNGTLKNSVGGTTKGLQLVWADVDYVNGCTGVSDYYQDSVPEPISGTLTFSLTKGVAHLTASNVPVYANEYTDDGTGTGTFVNTSTWNDTLNIDSVLTATGPITTQGNRSYQRGGGCTFSETTKAKGRPASASGTIAAATGTPDPYSSNYANPISVTMPLTLPDYDQSGMDNGSYKYMSTC
jgi:hypothetical protein